MTRREEMLALPAVPDDDKDFTPDLARKIVAKYQELLRLSQAEPGYVVKPLEWRTHKGDDFCDVHYDSDAIGGSYTIEARKNGFDLWKPNVQSERYASLDEAKSAAQADFEQRIRSAITATVGTAEPGYVAGFEACREATTALLQKYPNRDLPSGMMLAAIAALPAPATASEGWQDIETAPKDGTYVLVYRPILGTRAACVEHFEKGFWVAGSCMWPGEPSHWMPLPAAPARRSAT